MIRRSVIEDFNLYYSDSLPGVEDYEYFIRASKVTDLANIMDRNLFTYRWAVNNTSMVNKYRDLKIITEFVHQHISDTLGLDFSDTQLKRIGINYCFDGESEKDFPAILDGLNDDLLTLTQKNEEVGYFDQDALIKTMRHRWSRAKYELDIKYRGKIPSDVLTAWKNGAYYDAWMD